MQLHAHSVLRWRAAAPYSRLAAALALLGGLAYTEWGVASLAIGATFAVVAPALVILLARRPAAPVLEPAS